MRPSTVASTGTGSEPLCSERLVHLRWRQQVLAVEDVRSASDSADVEGVISCRGATDRVPAMRVLAWLGSLRLVVTVLTVVTALHMALVAVGNVTDFGTNQKFVEHVFAMDTTFRSPNMMWRAITDPGLATAAYIAVIVWESITALVLVAASVFWVRALVRRRATEVARQLSTFGWLMETVLFGGGFIVVGGEWFQMWQSAKWNGLQAALQNLLIASVCLILVQLLPWSSSSGRREPTGGQV